MKRGQMSVEFMLLIAIMLLYISTLVLPNVELASDSTKEIAGVGQSRIAAEKIVQTANQISLAGTASKETIKIYVPENSTIDCTEGGSPVGEDANISFSYILRNTSVPITSCQSLFDGDSDSICTKKFSIMQGPIYECHNFPVTGPKTPQIVLEKLVDTSAGNTVKVRISASQQ